MVLSLLQNAILRRTSKSKYDQFFIVFFFDRSCSRKVQDTLNNGQHPFCQEMRLSDFKQVSTQPSITSSEPIKVAVRGATTFPPVIFFCSLMDRQCNRLPMRNSLILFTGTTFFLVFTSNTILSLP